MNIPEHYGLGLAKEISRAINLMRSEEDRLGQLFYFSAALGESGRILNYHWDPTLALFHVTLQAVHSSANNRIQSVESRREPGVYLPPNFMELLVEALQEAHKAIVESDDHRLMRVMTRLAELAYVCTGNGYYLYKKGAISLDRINSESLSTGSG